jgi:hypothetical protein
MKLYKLTDQNAQTMNNTQWGPGVTHETDGRWALCGPGWLHAYEHPLLAEAWAARAWAARAAGLGVNLAAIAEEACK